MVQVTVSTEHEIELLTKGTDQYGRCKYITRCSCGEFETPAGEYHDVREAARVHKKEAPLSYKVDDRPLALPIAGRPTPKPLFPPSGKRWRQAG